MNSLNEDPQNSPDPKSADLRCHRFCPCYVRRSPTFRSFFPTTNVANSRSSNALSEDRLGAGPLWIRRVLVLRDLCRSLTLRGRSQEGQLEARCVISGRCSAVPACPTQAPAHAADLATGRGGPRVPGGQQPGPGPGRGRGTWEHFLVVHESSRAAADPTRQAGRSRGSRHEKPHPCT